jgi:hypothetical protein
VVVVLLVVVVMRWLPAVHHLQQQQLLLLVTVRSSRHYAMRGAVGANETRIVRKGVAAAMRCVLHAAQHHHRHFDAVWAACGRGVQVRAVQRGADQHPVCRSGPSSAAQIMREEWR